MLSQRVEEILLFLSIPFSWTASPCLSVFKPWIVMIHILYNPLCSNDHNCYLVIVYVVVWQNSIRAETLVISCFSLEPQYVAGQIDTQKYLFKKKWMNEWMNGHRVQIPHLKDEDILAQLTRNLLQVNDWAETRTKSLTTLSPDLSL